MLNTCVHYIWKKHKLIVKGLFIVAIISGGVIAEGRGKISRTFITCGVCFFTMRILSRSRWEPREDVERFLVFLGFDHECR